VIEKGLVYHPAHRGGENNARAGCEFDQRGTKKRKTVTRGVGRGGREGVYQGGPSIEKKKSCFRADEKGVSDRLAGSGRARAKLSRLRANIISENREAETTPKTGEA